MADFADLASEASGHFLDDALAAHRARRSGGLGAARCEECGEEIPAARRAMVPTATRCVGCQSVHEREAR